MRGLRRKSRNLTGDWRRVLRHISEIAHDWLKLGPEVGDIVNDSRAIAADIGEIECDWSSFIADIAGVGDDSFFIVSYVRDRTHDIKRVIDDVPRIVVAVAALRSH